MIYVVIYIYSIYKGSAQLVRNSPHFFKVLESHRFASRTNELHSNLSQTNLLRPGGRSCDLNEIHQNPMRNKDSWDWLIPTWTIIHPVKINHSLIHLGIYNIPLIYHTWICTCSIIPGLVPVVNNHADRKSPDPFQMALFMAHEWEVSLSINFHGICRIC